MSARFFAKTICQAQNPHFRRAININLCLNRYGESSNRVACVMPMSTSSVVMSLSSPVVNQGTEAEKWDLYASVCLERRPIISKEMTELELKYLQLCQQQDLEMSKLSDHEIRQTKDLAFLEKLKRGEVEQGEIKTSQDFEDESNVEFQKFVHASRTTSADKKIDTKSLDRALDSHLLLVVQQKLGNDFQWACPQGKLKEGETLRQAADRILNVVCPDITARVVGNAPWGFYKYKYPKATTLTNGKGEKVEGAKVFFYKAQVLSGDLKKLKKTKTDSKQKSSDTDEFVLNDYDWLTRPELKSKLQERYYKRISEFLIDEA